MAGSEGEYFSNIKRSLQYHKECEMNDLRPNNVNKVTTICPFHYDHYLHWLIQCNPEALQGSCLLLCS